MRDIRYDHIKSIWKAGDLDSFSKIFTIIPKTTVSEDLGLSYGRFERKLRNPDLFTIREIRDLSELIDLDFRDLVNLILTEVIGVLADSV